MCCEYRPYQVSGMGGRLEDIAGGSDGRVTDARSGWVEAPIGECNEGGTGFVTKCAGTCDGCGTHVSMNSLELTRKTDVYAIVYPSVTVVFRTSGGDAPIV